jgi:filamentous hemagglutinin family protein
MNRIFRSIWNDKTGTFVAVSENAKSGGNKSSPSAPAVAGAVPSNSRFALKALALSLMLAFGSNVYALPTGGAVSAGSASIAGGAGKTTINQSSQNVAINWQSFSIGKTEAVQFVQPNSNSVALNRVLGADPSSILGSLSANGKVFLVNPNGILFGQGAQVNVGGLVASTLTITDGDFMAGRYNFAGAGNRTILNQGSINADGGYVALLGANVSNQGVISAKLGTVALAAGNAVTLDVAGDGLLNVTVSQGALNALVQNGGLIRADGGQVLLSAQAAGNLLPSVVNNTGVIQAQTIENHNGTIRLLGDMQSGTVNVSGTLDASGTGAGQTGGNVTATGQHVGLFGAHIDASGDAGGGTVLVGGDLHGANPAIQNASATYMSADSTISADAITNGSGGMAVLWANDSTRAYGSITARGGAQGGDGGLIETSGHWLDVAGISVSASALNGKGGAWLLDPNNVTIQAGADTNVTASPNFTSTNDNAIVTPASIQTALNAGTNVVVTTGTGGTNAQLGDITVAAALTWTTANSLTLNAAHDVIVNFPITATTVPAALTGSAIVLTAGNDVKINAAMTASSNNSAIRLTAGNDIIAGFAITASAVDTVINMSAGNNVTSTSAVTASGLRDKIDMIAAGNGNVDVTTVTASGGGSMNLRANNNVTVRGVLTADTATAPVVSPVILIADNDGTGPGVTAGTVIFAGAGIQSITPSTAIRFNPAGYANTNAEVVAYQAKVSAILVAKAWVFGLGDNKIYDGTRTATVSGLKPDISAANPAVTGVLAPVTTPLFDTKHVGTNKLITFGSAFADPAYELFAPFGTAVGTYTTRANITVRPLTVTAVTDTRVYNGTTSSVGVPIVAGLQVGDGPVDTLNGALTQAYASKNVLGAGNSTLVANGGPYTVNDGNGGNNYSVAVINAPGTITPLALVGGITAANKVYDGNNSAAILTRTLATPIAGDTVSYTGGAALFSDKNVANGKTVTGTGLSLAGADAGNYTVNTTATTTANITPAPLTIQANNNTKVYGQTFTPASTAFTTPVAPVAGEIVGSVTETSPAGTPPTAAVPGPYAITPSAATGGTFTPSNYIITYVNGALTVTPAPLTVKANDATKIYGQTFTPAGTAFTTPVAPQNGETVGSVTETSPTGTPPTAAVPGPYAITPSSATGGTFTPANYTVTYVNGALTVTPVVPPPVVVTPPFSPPPVVLAAETPQIQETVQDTLTSSPLIQYSVGAVTGGLTGLNLAVIGTGVRMPPVQVAEVLVPMVPVAAVPEAPPVQPTPVVVPREAPPVQPTPFVVPPEAPPTIYVPPQRPRKPDRN